VGSHDAGAVAEDGDSTHTHRGGPQIEDNLNEWLWRRAHELCEHGGQALIGSPIESGEILWLHSASRLSDVGKVKSAIMFATIAQCSGCDAVVFCVQDGVDAVIKGKIKEKGKVPQDVPTFEQRLEDALKVGVKFQLCEQVAINRNLSKEDLIERTEIVDGGYLITYALEYDGMLYF
jgi:predicted peroxiredoxin